MATITRAIWRKSNSSAFTNSIYIDNGSVNSITNINATFDLTVTGVGNITAFQNTKLTFGSNKFNSTIPPEDNQTQLTFVSPNNSNDTTGFQADDTSTNNNQRYSNFFFINSGTDIEAAAGIANEITLDKDCLSVAGSGVNGETWSINAVATDNVIKFSRVDADLTASLVNDSLTWSGVQNDAITNIIELTGINLGLTVGNTVYSDTTDSNETTISTLSESDGNTYITLTSIVGYSEGSQIYTKTDQITTPYTGGSFITATKTLTSLTGWSTTIPSNTDPVSDLYELRTSFDDTEDHTTLSWTGDSSNLSYLAGEVLSDEYRSLAGGAGDPTATSEIVSTDGNGNVTYRVTLTYPSSSTTSFEYVSNKGTIGSQGIAGVSITGSSANGVLQENGSTIVTLTFTYSDLTTTSATFTVPKGQKGDDGADGSDGSDGADGVDGSKGDKGDTGNTGISISSQSAVGTLQGDGNTLVTVTTVFSDLNTTIYTYTVNSVKGDRGEKGNIGDTGKSLTSQSAVSTVKTDGNTLITVTNTFSDNTTSEYSYTVTTTKGDPGPKGDAGGNIAINFEDKIITTNFNSENVNTNINTDDVTTNFESTDLITNFNSDEVITNFTEDSITNNITPTEVDINFSNVGSQGKPGEDGNDIIGTFEPNRFYKKDTAVVLSNFALYIAKIDFTSGETFNEDNWNAVKAGSDLTTGGQTGSNSITIKINSGSLAGYSSVWSKPIGAPTLTANLYNNSALVSSVSKSIFDSSTLTANILKLTAGSSNQSNFPFESLTNVTSSDGTVGTISGNIVNITLDTFALGIPYGASGIVKIQDYDAQTLSRSALVSISRFTPFFYGISSAVPTTFSNLEALTNSQDWSNNQTLTTTSAGNFYIAIPDTTITSAELNGNFVYEFNSPTTITKDDINGNTITYNIYVIEDALDNTIINRFIS